MSNENFKGLLTPTGELVLKDKKIEFLDKNVLNGVAERILHLDLRNNEIKHLENSVITSLTHLRSLDLRENKLEVLTEKISALTHLKFLKLDHNALTVLPLELFKLPLNLLSVGDNSIFALPAQICELSSLVSLNLSENQIKSLPAELGLLENLKILHVHRNQFSALPSSLGNLALLEEISLEWFRYTSPPLPKIIKGHLGEAIICGFRDFCHKSAQNGEFEITLIQFLNQFSENTFDINKVDIRQRSSLHLSVANGDVGVMQGLIDSKCDLDLLDIDGFSPLVIALKEDNITAAKILLHSGARLDIGGGTYGSVLNLAVLKSEPWLVNALIKAGVNVSLCDTDGNSCLHHLMTVYKRHKHRNAIIANMIISAGAKVNALNNEK